MMSAVVYRYYHAFLCVSALSFLPSVGFGFAVLPSFTFL